MKFPLLKYMNISNLLCYPTLLKDIYYVRVLYSREAVGNDHHSARLT